MSQEFNDGHITEGMDRCSTVILLLTELLDQHPAIKKSGAQGDIDVAIASVLNAYQKVGSLSV